MQPTDEPSANLYLWLVHQWERLMYHIDAILLFLLVSIILLIVSSALLQWLWNATMPDVFGARKITFWQALRLLLIAAILFGSGGLLSFQFSG